MPRSPPLMRSKTSASLSRPRLPTFNALRIEVGQPAVGVVGPLHPIVGRPVVQSPEAVAIVERVRVERLSPTELLDHLLDPAVVATFGLPLCQRPRGPESDVCGRRVRPAGAERPTRRGR